MNLIRHEQTHNSTALPKLRTAIAIIGLGVTMFGHSAFASDDTGMNDLDACILERGTAAVVECKLEFAKNPKDTGDIAVKEDSTDQDASTGTFRFAGSGLERRTIRRAVLCRHGRNHLWRRG